MKKWKIIHTAFTFLFLATWTYFDFSKKLHSFHWLIFTLTGFLLIVVGQIMIAVLKKQESKSAIIVLSCVSAIFLYLVGHNEIDKYKNHLCDARFGREFNERRHRLGAPEIPADWYVDDEWHRSATWKANDTLGHTRKDIGIDSSCAIIYEYDEYKFKPIHGKARSMLVETRYTTTTRNDAVSYSYEPGIDTGRYITRHEADSIFAAEKIKKDY